MLDKSVPIQLATQRVRLVEKLGAGASAEVWSVAPLEATPIEGGAAPTHGPWALKIGRPDTSRYLASEAERLVFALSNHLPQALSVGRLAASGLPDPSWNNAPYVLMTRVAGVPLSQVLATLAQA